MDGGIIMKHLAHEVAVIVLASIILLAMAAGYVAYTRSKVMMVITMHPEEQ